MLSAIVFAETGIIVSVFAWKAFAIAAEPFAWTPMMRGRLGIQPRASRSLKPLWMPEII